MRWSDLRGGQGAVHTHTAAAALPCKNVITTRRRLRPSFRLCDTALYYVLYIVIRFFHYFGCFAATTSALRPAACGEGEGTDTTPLGDGAARSGGAAGAGDTRGARVAEEDDEDED